MNKLRLFFCTVVLFASGLFLPLHSPYGIGSLFAQQVGTWQIYPSYWISTHNVPVGPSVYNLTNGNLLRYDSEDTSVRTYDSLHDLSDHHIAHIAYSPEARKLILVYDNQNIDLLDLDDNVQNIVSLKESTLSNKTVNYVHIEGSVAYLCTGFGFITVDMKEGVILDTYRLGLNVQAAIVWNGHIYLGTSTGLYRSTEDNLHLASNWKPLSPHGSFRKMLIFDGAFYYMNVLGVSRVDADDTVSTLRSGDYSYIAASDKLIFGDASAVYVYSSPTSFRRIEMPNQWQHVSPSGSTYWASEGLHGLKGYKLTDDGFVETAGKIQPNSPVRDLFYRMQFVGDRLLVAGGINTPYPIYNPATAMYYEDGVWTNFDEEGPAEQYPDLRRYNTTHLVQDPSDPTHHFASPYRTGLYEYRNGKFVRLYNSDNSPLRQILNYGLNYVGCAGLQYDADGNLWLMNQQTDTIVRILQPSGKWLSLYYDEINSIETPDDYLFTTSDINFLVSRRMSGRGFFAFDTNGTLNNVRDDRHLLRSTLVNQDGTSYSPDEFYCMAEDLDGRVWCGTQLGLFIINRPDAFFDNDFTFEQIKIARNDGSGLADYLLSGLAITCIAVDGANRKWIGTASNGLYLVSADGQELLHHFTAEDSPLLSNYVQCLAIHPTTGCVMIGTDVGLCSYVSDATEAEDELNFDRITVYPNPVRPDYTGPIVVQGLTMDSEVKICSTTGQLIWSGHSNGGTFTWNGQNKRGRRVSSGVYNVIANTAEGKKAVVSRIIVIK